MSRLRAVRALFGVLAVALVLGGLVADLPAHRVLIGETSFGNAALILPWLTPWLWLGLVRPGGRESDERLLALVLVVGALSSLGAFPVWGSQVAYASVLVVLVGFLCARDAADLGCVPPRLRASIAGAALAVLLVAKAGLEWSFYQRNVPLNLPGASLLRLPAQQVSLYRHVAAVLHANCDTFIGFNGFNSMHFWSGVAPPTQHNATVWAVVLTDEEQGRVADGLVAHPRSCVLAMPRALEQSRGSRLANFVREEFEPVANIGGGFQLLKRVRRPSPSPSAPPGAATLGAGRGAIP